MSEALTPLAPVSSPLPATPFASPEPRPRLWPGVTLVVVMWLATTVPGWVIPGTLTQFFLAFWTPLVVALLLLVWWLFASRFSWTDRLFALAAVVLTGAAAAVLCHPSFRLLLLMYALPVVLTGWVGWLLVARSRSGLVRRVGLLVVFALIWGGSTLLRFDGIDGSMSAAFSFRWSPTPEERYVASLENESVAAASAEPVVLLPGDWNGFRGPARDGIYRDGAILGDWSQNPPQLVWRRRVGPGWGSFAMVGGRLYTQEQRGEKEAVVCLDAATGEPCWVHEDEARFTEVVAGPGPRATPTFHEGKIHALGAAGRLNCLEAATGRVIWSRDIVEDFGAKVPQWGFAASPLVAGGVVMVAGGPVDRGVLAYEAATGKPAWSAGAGGHTYCSPQRATLAGVEQVLVTTEKGLTALEPGTGKVLWQHDWVMPEGMARVVQPTVVSDTDVLLGTGFGLGLRRVRVRRTADGWAEEEVWTSQALKPYYNDQVVHEGHVYGFDGLFFTCVRLEDGTSRWRARGYGHGQVLLLAQQGLLLVLSEKGEAVLLDATPEARRERGRFQAIQGKTWNHPVVAHGRLYVRNGEEAACYRVAEAAR